MPPLAEILVTFSLLGVFTLCLKSLAKRRDVKRFVLQLLLIAGFVAALNIFLGFPKVSTWFDNGATSKGTNVDGLYANWQMYLLAYAAMICGMLGQYLYDWLSRPASGRIPFDWRNFVAPLLVSPIIFVPLFGTLTSDPGAEKANLMIFLVAFENGFFFKSYFDQRAKADHSAAANPA
jgi:hypothetical protein